MRFPFNVYLLAFASAALTTFLAVPVWRAWCVRIGLVDDPGHRKIHSAPVPLAGGLAVLTGLLAPVLAAAVVIQTGWFEDWVGTALDYGWRRRAGQLGAILAGAVGMVALGWMDDKYELGAAVKFGGQVAIAGLVAAAGVRITLFVANPLFSYAITILWILTVTNALNFMDNMNGLAGGLGAIGAWSFGWSAAVHGQYLVAAVAFLACGALLGFLPYNFPKATVFLGDSGSHLVGYLLAVLAILPHFYSAKNPDALAVLSPLIILAVPLGDLVSVVIIRWRLGKPVYVGDNNHLSHQLTRRGLSRARAVMLIWLLAGLAGAAAFVL